MNNTSRIHKQNPLTDFFRGFRSFLKGMRVTGTNLVAREKITVQYPYERVEVSPPHWQRKQQPKRQRRKPRMIRIGVMEYWSVGVLVIASPHDSITPSLHFPGERA